MKDIYVFPAIFSKEDDNSYNVRFPDIDGAFTFGSDFEEAMLMAKDCLELNLDTIDEIPKISDLKDIQLETGEYIVMIQADMLSYRKKYNSKPVKKTLTIPKWLNDLGTKKKINFSKLLQKALQEELKV